MDALTRVVEAVRERHDVSPSVVIRSPGRVNLIGEHTDYSLLPVMPFAIDRGVYVAVCEGLDRIEVDSLTHPDPVTIEPGGGDRSELSGWHRYFAAAVDAVGFVGGARVLIDADLPATGGLSSSSAFTVGVLMALGTFTGDPPLRQELPELALAAERSIGVESGAMDQTVISLATEGHALRIDFDPFATRHVPVSDDLGIVAAYSGRAAPKGGDANHSYNSRVVACRAAALLLASLEGVDSGSPPVLSKVRSSDLVDSLPAEVTAAAVASQLGVDPERMVKLTATEFDADVVLPIRSVAAHVLSEARRVDDAEAALEANDYHELGRLLDASHESLRDFGASSQALDRLVGAMREAGAYGARLTGAGFGGYAIGICPLDRIDALIEAADQATGGPAFRVRPSDGVSGV
jgi:galactokinase